MSVISGSYYELISHKIFEIRGIAQYGTVIEPGHTQCGNRSALIFALEAVLDAHRRKFSSHWSPLEGKRALEHLLLKKYAMPLSQIRSLNLSDIVLLLQEELHPDKIPEEARQILNSYNVMHARNHFPDFNEEEWDPNLYLTLPVRQRW